MSPEQMESLGLARNILKNMMDAGAVQEPEPEDERPETPAKGVKFSFSGADAYGATVGVVHSGSCDQTD